MDTQFSPHRQILRGTKKFCLWYLGKEVRYQKQTLSHTTILKMSNYWLCRDNTHKVSISECPYQSAHTRVPISECRYQSVHIRVPISECPYQSVHIRVSISECPYQSVHTRVPISECPYQSAHIRVSISESSTLYTLHPSHPTSQSLNLTLSTPNPIHPPPYTPSTPPTLHPNP